MKIRKAKSQTPASILEETIVVIKDGETDKLCLVWQEDLDSDEIKVEISLFEEYVSNRESGEVKEALSRLIPTVQEIAEKHRELT